MSQLNSLLESANSYKSLQSDRQKQYVYDLREPS